MGFGDTAKAALDQALAAYKATVQLEALVGHVAKAAESFEKRLTERLETHERRTEARIEALEARVREAETRVASLNGKVDGALAEAIKVVLLDPEMKKKLAEATAASIPRRTDIAPEVLPPLNQ